MKKKNEKNTSWFTTDEEQRELRRQRAKEESFSVRCVQQSPFPPFHTYEVSKPDSPLSKYIVELRSLTHDVNTCTCPDFATNGLGTCKHIEKVKSSVKNKRGKVGIDSPVTEIFMQRDPYCVRVFVGKRTGENTRRLLNQFISDGNLIDDSVDTLKSFISLCKNEIANGCDDIRISREVHQYLASIAEQEKSAIARKKFSCELEANDGNLPFLKKKLYPYQREGMMHLAFGERALLADEMGLGKTVQAIAAAILLRETVGIRKVLVVAPTSLKSEWEEQIKIFTDASTCVLYGPYAERMRIYKSSTTFFLITNYEQVLRDIAFINDSMKPDLVILDEAQRIKNWKTKTARKIKRLNSKYAFVLTGTPLENRIDELYSLLDFINPKLLGSVFRFNRKFYNFDEDLHVCGMQNLSELHALTQQVMLRRRKSEINEDLPPVTRKNYFVGITNAQKSDYDDHLSVVAQLIYASKKRQLRPEEMDKLQRHLACMRMLCDTCYIIDRKTKESPKVDELKCILDDIWNDDPNRKVLIFSEWTRMLELVEEMLDASDISYAIHTGSINQKQRRIEINNFKNNPDCKVLLSSEAGGVGLNLQAASVVINLDLPWNPAKLEQRIARAWRKHQARSVDVINVVAKDTIEEQMIAKLKYKQGLADFILDAHGDEETFSKPNSRKAFLEQLKEILDTDKAMQATVAPAKPKPKTPSPKERLSAAIKTKTDDLISCTVKMAPRPATDESDASANAGKGNTSGVGANAGKGNISNAGNGNTSGVGANAITGYDSDAEQIASVLAVSSDPDSDSAIKCAAALGIPQENVITITPETQELLKKLEALGFLTINRDAVIQQVETGTPSMPTEELLRRRRIKPLLEIVDRKLQLAMVLGSNNFLEEASAALDDGVVKMLGIFYVMNGAEKDESLEPVTPHMLNEISSNGTFPQYMIDELIQAHQHAMTIPETTRALTSARAFFAQ